MQIGLRCDARHGPRRVRAQNTKTWEPVLLSSPGSSSRLWERRSPRTAGTSEDLVTRGAAAWTSSCCLPSQGPVFSLVCAPEADLCGASRGALALWLLTGLSIGEPPARGWREERRESEWSVHGRCPCSFIADFSLLFSPPMSH